MTTEPKPNGLDNTEMKSMKLTDRHLGLTQLEVVPVVLTQLSDDGTDQERFYTLEMGVQQIKSGKQFNLILMVPESYRDAFVDALKVEHFPDQPCTHSQEGHTHD